MIDEILFSIYRYIILSKQYKVYVVYRTIMGKSLDTIRIMFSINNTFLVLRALISKPLT